MLTQQEMQAVVDSISEYQILNLDESRLWPVNPAESDKSASATGSPWHGQELTALLTPLVQALEAQTAAINALAASNQALVEAMAQAEGDEDGEPRFDLSGKRV